MGASTERTSVRNGAVRHLRDALAAEDATEKDFHLKQAIQLLDLDATDD